MHSRMGKLIGAAFFTLTAVDTVGDFLHEFISFAFAYAFRVKAGERHRGVHDG